MKVISKRAYNGENYKRNVKEATRDHFVIENKKVYAGKHIILDMWNVKFNNKIKKLENIMISAIKESGATLLHIHLHHFNNGKGISGVAVLAESHISVHSWPERNYIAFDIFMCGATFPEIAANVITKSLEPERIEYKTILRGEI